MSNRAQFNQIPLGLYTAEERARRDTTIWTTVQGVLAPLQFIIFVISLGLVIRYLVNGTGYDVATWSIIFKTIVLYVIMITGAIWEKKRFWSIPSGPSIFLGGYFFLSCNWTSHWLPLGTFYRRTYTKSTDLVGARCVRKLFN